MPRSTAALKLQSVRVLHSGESLLEGVLEDPRHHQGDEVGWIFPVLIQDVDIYRPDVHVRVGQSRQQCHPRAVDDRVVPPRSASTSGANLSYPLAFDDY